MSMQPFGFELCDNCEGCEHRAIVEEKLNADCLGM